MQVLLKQEVPPSRALYPTPTLEDPVTDFKAPDPIAVLLELV